MITYNILYICLVIFNYKKNIQKYSYIFFSIIFFIISFLRNTGTDWEMYKNIFEKLDFSGTSEIGYKYLNVLVSFFSQNFNIFLLFCALIIYGFKYYSMYKYSYIPLLTLLMNFCYFRGDIFFVRQNIAEAILIFSLKYILEKKFLKFLLVVLLASSFHRGAIIFLLSYSVNYILFSKKNNIYIYILFLFLSYFSKPILLYSTDYLPSAYSYRIIEYIKHSGTNFGYKSWLSKDLIVVISLLNRSFIYFFGIFNLNKMDIQTKKIFQIYSYSVYIYILLYKLGELTRLSTFFICFEILFLPNVLSFMKNKNYLKILFIIYFYLKLLSGLSNFYNVYVPIKLIGEISL